MTITYKPLLVFLIVNILALPVSSHANVLTYYFYGEFESQHSLFNSGDLYFGSYTFNPTAETVPHPDPTLDIQSEAISPLLPGTSWNMKIDSSSVGIFYLEGSGGIISVGNDTAAWGDRYSVSLFGNQIDLPKGYTLSLFQIGLDLHYWHGTDLISSNSIDVLPNVGLPGVTAGGRLILNDGIQSFHRITHLSNVPLPSTVWLLFTALIAFSCQIYREKIKNAININNLLLLRGFRGAALR